MNIYNPSFLLDFTYFQQPYLALFSSCDTTLYSQKLGYTPLVAITKNNVPPLPCIWILYQRCILPYAQLKQVIHNLKVFLFFIFLCNVYVRCSNVAFSLHLNALSDV